jgi:hypothetical protein
MKKTVIILSFVCILLTVFVLITAFFPVNVSAQTSRVEVSFVFTKQSGFASNQFAVWIEDTQGRYIKTLYATRFTAAGGWQRRDLSLAQWVKKSNLAGMNKVQVDAITGPTPKNGNRSYVWDGTDSTGRSLPAGEYRVFVEGTLRNENYVLYTAAIKLGERGQVNAQAQYFGSSTKERDMIGLVTVRY